MTTKRCACVEMNGYFGNRRMIDTSRCFIHGPQTAAHNRRRDRLIQSLAKAPSYPPELSDSQITRLMNKREGRNFRYIYGILVEFDGKMWRAGSRKNLTRKQAIDEIRSWMQCGRQTKGKFDVSKTQSTL